MRGQIKVKIWEHTVKTFKLIVLMKNMIDQSIGVGASQILKVINTDPHPQCSVSDSCYSNNKDILLMVGYNYDLRIKEGVFSIMSLIWRVC